MTPQEIRNRQLADAGLPPEDYEPNLREGDTIQVCEIDGADEDRYIGWVIEVIEHGYYLLVEIRLPSGDCRHVRTYRDGPPEVGAVTVKVLRRVDRPRQPEQELGQLYWQQSLVRRTAHPRAEEIVPGARFRVKIDGYFTTVRILALNNHGCIAVDMATEHVVEILDPLRLRKLLRCPECGAADLYEVPVAGWPCWGCRVRRLSH